MYGCVWARTPHAHARTHTRTHTFITNLVKARPFSDMPQILYTEVSIPAHMHLRESCTLAHLSGVLGWPSIVSVGAWTSLILLVNLLFGFRQNSWSQNAFRLRSCKVPSHGKNLLLSQDLMRHAQRQWTSPARQKSSKTNNPSRYLSDCMLLDGSSALFVMCLLTLFCENLALLFHAVLLGCLLEDLHKQANIVNTQSWCQMTCINRTDQSILRHQNTETDYHLRILRARLVCLPERRPHPSIRGPCLLAAERVYSFAPNTTHIWTPSSYLCADASRESWW